MGWIRTFKPLVPRLIVAAASLAVATWHIAHGAQSGVDSTALGLVGLAALAMLFPWDRVTEFKAFGIEITAEKPEVKDAVKGLPKQVELDGEPAASATVLPVDVAEIIEAIKRLEPILKEVRGRRVLWIDDHPHDLLPERRLLRALGLQVVCAKGNEEAVKILSCDNDFDLIISDTSRRSKKGQSPQNIASLDPVKFVVLWIRAADGGRQDAHLKRVAVLFYSAHETARLMEITAPARATYPPADFCNHPSDLVRKSVAAIWLSSGGEGKAIGKRERIRPAWPAPESRGEVRE